MSLNSNKQSKSAVLYQRALKIMPGGCSRNTILRKPHPLYAASGHGFTVTDVEGTARIDFSNNMTSLIHGHSHPDVTQAVTAQLSKGTAFTLATEIEIEYAELICSRNKSFEKVRFVNSGTEAVMGCLKASRAYTGKQKIAKVEGAYHGLYDYAEISQTSRPDNWGDAKQPNSTPVARGTPDSAINDVIVIPFNNIEAALSILDQHADELACVLLDLMPHRVGLISASNEFVKAIKQWTLDNNALLVFDEVITFRTQFGGAQDNYDAVPDLTAMGKMVGGGFPVGAIVGKEEVMDVMNPLVEPVLFPHSGTFSANPITMVAGLTSMALFDKQAVDRLNKLAHIARENIREAIRIADIKACVTGTGSLFRVHMKPESPKNYRESILSHKEKIRLKSLLDYLFDHGFMMINTCSGALSTVMTEKEVEMLSDTMLDGFRAIK